MSAALNSVLPELLDYRREISMIVMSECEKLDACSQELSDLKEHEACTRLDALLIQRARDAVEYAKRNLDELRRLAIHENEDVAFNELMKYAGYAFRCSAGARSLLLRHTPTMVGLPHALDPVQNHRVNPGGHIIDYARNAYFQYQDSVGGSPKKIIDHPVLEKTATSVANTLYGEHWQGKSILFSSAMGAIDSLIDYIALVSRAAGKTNVIGGRCWFEIQQYADEHYPSEFLRIDEQDVEAIIKAIDNPAVLGIVIEPLGNHPDMAVVDLKRISEKLRSYNSAEQKIIVFDIVHTPELNIIDKYFSEGIPQGLCIALVISGVKFLQAGWDISKSGCLMLSYNEQDFCNHTPPVHEKLIEIRSISGRAPSLEEAYLADIETSHSLRSRLARYDTNTKYFVTRLDDWLREHHLGHVSSPWLEGHPGHNYALSDYGTGGRVMFLYFNDKYVKESELGELFKDLCKSAEENGVSLMAVPTFGLASPHIHVVIRPGLQTSIRVSTGSTNRETIDRLLKVFYRYLGKYVGN